MKLIFCPHPSLLGGETRRTEVDVSEDETMQQILERVKLILSLWLNPASFGGGGGGGGRKEKEWQLTLEGGTKIDQKFTPKELHLTEGQMLYVNLKEEIPANPLDALGEDTEVCDVLGSSSSFSAPSANIPSSYPSAIPSSGGAASSSETPSILDDYSSAQNNAQMPTEEDVLRYEEAKQAALNRARDIERNKGLFVSHRKILHDEAVDDYDDDEYGGYEYFEDVGFGGVVGGGEEEYWGETDNSNAPPGGTGGEDDAMLYNNNNDVIPSADGVRNANTNPPNLNNNRRSQNRNNPISPFR